MGLGTILRALHSRNDALGMECRFAQHAPSAQRTVDLFAEGWASHLPIPGVHSGQHALFEDPTVRWLLRECEGVLGKRVLELGPLEGAHSRMLQDAGAREVVGVESNARAYLKCLVAKELLSSDRCKFLFGDFREFLRTSGERFDASTAGAPR